MEDTRSLGLLDGAPVWDVRALGWTACLTIACLPKAMKGASRLSLGLTVA